MAARPGHSRSRAGQCRRRPDRFALGRLRLESPLLSAFYLSLTNYDILRPPKWAGLANYQRAFFEDTLFWPSLGRSFYFAVGLVPLCWLSVNCAWANLTLAWATSMSTWRGLAVSVFSATCCATTFA